MKTYILTSIIFLQSVFSYAQIIDPVWQFAGPRSTNNPTSNPLDPNYNAFLSGQIDDIAVDPGNPNHIVTSGFAAGIWETNDYDASVLPPTTTWHLFPDFDNALPVGIGNNSVHAVEFRNSNELYAATKNAVFKYDYSLTTWTQLGALPNASQLKTNQIVFFPNDANHVFVCTNKGLLESTDAGATWFQSPSGNPVVGNIHGIVFIEKATPGTYFWYVSGDDPAKHALFMESTDDGITFNDITTYMSSFVNDTSFAGICLGDQTDVGGDREIYISTAFNIAGDKNWTVSERRLHKFTRNIIGNTFSVQQLANGTTGNEYSNVPVRMIIGYDPVNNRVITGGVKPHQYNITTNAVSNLSSIHDDYHAIYINPNTLPPQIFLGCDGGFASVIFGTNYLSHRLNYGLDICQMNGFSGATESNIYVYGQQDHLTSALFDETQGRVVAAHFAGENDGGLIDKFRNNQLIITDYQSYDELYFVNVNGVSDFASATTRGMYPPSNSPNYYFEPATNAYSIGQSFGVHPFFQHPYRQGRIYNTASGGSVFQFDPVSNKFVWKVRLDEGIQHFTCSPTLKSDPCQWCAPCTTSTFLKLHYLNWFNQPCGGSFSQLDKNTMYLVTTNNWDPCCYAASQVVKYIGGDIDDMWLDHQEAQDINGNPQWQLLTPDFQSATFGSMIETDIYHIRFTAVETSNWDKNSVYVSCSSDLNPTISFKVIFYDGITQTWSDYSAGIPADENVFTMIMDHAGNDGLYIATEKGIYYREKGMTAWVSYNDGAPGTLMPFVDSRQMEINYRENTLRAGTYGRGIWKSKLVCPSIPSLVIPMGAVSDYKEADDVTTISGSVNSTVTASIGSTVFRGTNRVTLEPGFTADGSSGTNYFSAFIHGCNGGSTSSYNYFRSTFDFSEKSNFDADEDGENEEGKIIIYPNPASEEINISLLGIEQEEIQQIVIMNIMEQAVYTSPKNQEPALTISVARLKPGIYAVQIKTDKKTIASNFIKQ
ncbi:MAG: T9SS type A sorting domain-containing protein [Bacteroidota bacterium]